jgi:Undecaprenyl-phosphate glucose phosphotransferase
LQTSRHNGPTATSASAVAHEVQITFNASPKNNRAIVGASFAVVAALSDVAAVLFTALMAGIAYKLLFYGSLEFTEPMLEIGVLFAILFLLPNIVSKEYSIPNYLTFEGHLRRSILLWNIAFFCVLAIGFVTKTTAMASRGAMLLFFFSGFGAIVLTRANLVRVTRTRVCNGGLLSRRVFIIGNEDDIGAFASRYNPSTLGMHVVSIVVLRDKDRLNSDLAQSVEVARQLRPDDVFILVPWSCKETIDACVEAFRRIPASIHLGPERAFMHYGDARLCKTGSLLSLQLVREPLSIGEVLGKRIFDLIGASLGLILLSPLLLFVSLLIRLDSKGPVFFLQRRSGFNQETFRIYKFRTMTTMEDGVQVAQALRSDKRVTRVGRLLRHANIDELPQLLNVLRGEMSLIGPRPHALAHDRSFEEMIALYARRHNMKPGITGWAQVNGFRGEILTERDIRARVEHDLYYIDNWSFWLDLRILWLTIFSWKAYQHAY